MASTSSLWPAAWPRNKSNATPGGSSPCVCCLRVGTGVAAAKKQDQKQHQAAAAPSPAASVGRQERQHHGTAGGQHDVVWLVERWLELAYAACAGVHWQLQQKQSRAA